MFPQLDIWTFSVGSYVFECDLTRHNLNEISRITDDDSWFVGPVFVKLYDLTSLRKQRIIK